ncbi:MAG: bifunctional hydroxymethylpyrimidine kinase/phosphomethylpyrimidine kinase [Actinobacteria bacterium]|nr:bifunctional hydroxymethylpyrimidine kinase/phosphomethylpyrimidine kinase [Actinomycetota bacterium]
MKPRVLIISGLDPSGASGLLLDVTISSSEGVITAGIPTCLVAENYRTVEGIQITEPDILRDSIDLVLEEGDFKATKIGLVPPSLVETLVEVISERKSQLGFVVFDPVLFSSSGFNFYEKEFDLLFELFRCTNIITPNIDEFEKLFKTNRENISEEELKTHLNSIKPANLLITSFERKKRIITNLFLTPSKTMRFEVEETEYDVRGTGCALSSLIATYVAKGCKPEKAIEQSMKRVSELIKVSVVIKNRKRRFVLD